MMEARQQCPRPECYGGLYEPWSWAEVRIVPKKPCGELCPRQNGNWQRTEAARRALEAQGWRYDAARHAFQRGHECLTWEQA